MSTIGFVVINAEDHNIIKANGKIMFKQAALEESSLSDPRTELGIRISTTVRIKYRKYYI